MLSNKKAAQRSPRGAVLLVLLCTLGLSGCVGMAISATTDAALAVAKIPFKVGGAVVDVVTGDEE